MVILLIVRAHQTTRKTGGQATQSLDSVGAHVLGVVVNNIQPSRGLGISANRGMGVSPMIRRLHNRTGETPVPSTD